jgi:hypothetical protein
MLAAVGLERGALLTACAIAAVQCAGAAWSLTGLTGLRVRLSWLQVTARRSRVRRGGGHLVQRCCCCSFESAVSTVWAYSSSSSSSRSSSADTVIRYDTVHDGYRLQAPRASQSRRGAETH